MTMLSTTAGPRVAAEVAPGRDPELSDEDEAPAGTPEYADLLDSEWLERSADARERDDDLVDIGLTLDLDARDDFEELACVLDLDVGTLLTSLPPGAARENTDSPELGDGTLGIGALREVLLPEEQVTWQRAEDDEAIGDSAHFPVFEPGSALPSAPPDADDADGDA